MTTVFHHKLRSVLEYNDQSNYNRIPFIDSCEFMYNYVRFIPLKNNIYFINNTETNQGFIICMLVQYIEYI